MAWFGDQSAVGSGAQPAADGADDAAHILHSRAAGFGDFVVNRFGNLCFAELFRQVSINDGFFGQLGRGPIGRPTPLV
jgi:hypothetical protein